MADKRAPGSPISDDTRDELRRRYLDGEPLATLAPELGVSVGSASRLTRDIRYARTGVKKCANVGCRRRASSRERHKGLCQDCHLEVRDDRESPGVLTDGKWVVARWGIRRWVPNKETQK